MSCEEIPDAMQQKLEAQKTEEQKLDNANKVEPSEKAEKIQSLLNQKKLRTGKLDCVIVMDLTYSMDPYIEKMQKELCELIEEIKRNNKELDAKFGFIGYKDFSDDPQVQAQQQKSILGKKKIEKPIERQKLITSHINILDFQQDMEKYQQFLMEMYADGGGDIPEDVAGGLNQALSLSWRSDSFKIVILVADQPTHGKQYQDPVLLDDYPEGHPFGIQLEDVITTFAKMKTMFLIFKITDNTEKMFSIIKQKMKERQAKVRCIDLRKALQREQEEKKLRKKAKTKEIQKQKEKIMLEAKKKENAKSKLKKVINRSFSEDESVSNSSENEEDEEEKKSVKSKELEVPKRKRSVCSIVNVKISNKIMFDSDDCNLSCNEEID